jgi:pimeloyl-ACP methyl ester carboxylesterase
MGGYTAMAMLRRAPDRVRALVLADTRDGADTDGARADRLEMARRVRADGVEPIVEPMVQRLLSATGREEPHIADPVRSRIRHCSAEGIAACQEAMAARPDRADVLAAVRVPVLVVCGAEDAVTPPEEMRAMAGRIPGARFSVVAGAGHLSSLEQPAAFGELLAGFLDEAYPPAR